MNWTCGWFGVGNVQKIAIFGNFFFAIGNDCRVLTRKKSGQLPQGLAYDFKDTTRTSFPGVWLAPLVEKLEHEDRYGW